MLGMQATIRAIKVGAELAFVDGGAGQDTITSSGADFLTLGFRPDAVLKVTGCTTAANDTALTGVEIQEAEAGTLYLPTGSVNTAEAGAAGTAICIAQGGSLFDLMLHGVIDVYSGSIPSSPDNAVSGTKLARLTVNGGAWAAGSHTNGIVLGAAASGQVDKDTADTIQGDGLIPGTAGWFRWKSNISDADGLSTTAYRIDGTVGTTSSYDMVVPTTAVTAGVPYTLYSLLTTFPQTYSG